MPYPALAAALAAPFHTVSDCVRLHAAHIPDATALVVDGEAIDYRRLDALLERVAAALHRDGVRPGDTVAICAATSIPYIAAYFGALRAGAVLAPLASSWHADSLRSLIEDARPKVIFGDAGSAKALAATLDGGARRLVPFGDGGFERWLEGAEAGLPAPSMDPSAPFNIIYSSGTTGTPKGIVQSHGMRWGNVKRGDSMGLGPGATLLLPIPLYSNLALVYLVAAVALGARTILMAKFDAGTYLRLASEHGATHTVLVPVQYQRILGHPDFDAHDLSSFRTKICAGSPFHARLKAETLERWPGALVEFYGMTEGGAACILEAHSHPDKLHTVGKPTGCDLRLIDDDGREVGPGEAGEIVGHSALMMSGYHNQPGKTRDVEWHDATGKRFIRTGDVARLDEDGFVILMDRKKDMIISGGFNIYPADLEDVLLAHPDVDEAAVVGAPSPAWGETPVGFVVLKAGRRADPAGLAAWANERLARTQRLAAIEIVDALPRNGMGKVVKPDLRAAISSQPGYPFTT